ncbi:GNAT family N-acetyltransferase [Neomicrococcus aestuarii]|uniref:GNAT family N-acetyltransferase n=1 Tax=Neomicrococcus aestuarii TaxID=556325 RepID=A0A1L2ZPD5_9MICC|nr:GNAT family protein [Neomicrococcus aestuarii]APF41067.1 GNAT family N-acetyltransferase [Neomicrococcus aestuarii]
MDPLSQPVLDALGFRLRPFEPKDAQLVREASLDPLIPLITTVPSNGTDKEILDFIDRQHHRLVERSGYSYAIADASSDQALGQIGLWLKDAGQGRASIGYWVSPRHRNKGIVSAALDAVSGWGLSLPEIYRLELYVEPWNEGSWRAAERCGYMREGLVHSWQEVGGQRKDMYMYSRLK